MKFLNACIAAALVAGANAHMVMKTPIPYGKTKLNNSPLDPSGSDFPCKNLFDLESDADVNHMAIGEPQTLSFTGSAVHGGGSCQVSLTKDLKPTKDSKWMVIKSIEGGCPAGSAGNLGNDAGADVAGKFQYTIPEGIAPGEYTIAWTWVNRIGNREFYMNCGRADVTGAKKKRYAPAPVVKRQSSFPDLFVANLEGVSHGCKTSEGLNILFPNPGPVVEKPTAQGEYGPPVGCEGGNGNTDSGAGSPPASSAAPVTTSAAAATTSVAATPSTSNAPGNFAEGASSSTTAPATSAPAATTTAAVTSAPAATTSAAAAPTSSAAAAPTAPTTPAPGSSTGAQTAGAACSNEGDWACAADGLSFQRCASGTWSVAIPLAGTKCTPGTSSAIQIVGKTKAKRGFRA